ncbi:MAG: SAM-dependent methyltransferase [Dermabacter sp.]|nr:SAM-dependent methyltransferase [Dermabacter sp.]
MPSTSAITELLTPDGMALLDSLPDYSDDAALALGDRLRRAGHSPALVAEALTQSRLRAKARDKFGDFAARMLFTAHGLEQATRLPIAAHHAARFRDAGVQKVADLGCGLGGDTIAKAGLGLSVIGVDLDPLTVALATVNTSVFENVHIELGAAEDFDPGRVQGLWFDPARRDARSVRVHDPEAASPPLSAIREAARKIGPVGAKLAPAIQHADLPPGTETQWVSWHSQVLEACTYFGPLARRAGAAGTETAVPGLDEGTLVARSALIFARQADGSTRPLHVLPDTSDDDALRTPEVGEIADLIVEPDGAIIRAGLLGVLARRLGAHTIDPTIAYLSASEASLRAAATAAATAPTLSTPLARAFRVRDVLPLRAKKIAAHLHAAGIGRVEILKRGADIDPAVFRTQLKLDKRASGAATLILTRAAGQRVAILADPA